MTFSSSSPPKVHGTDAHAVLAAMESPTHAPNMATQTSPFSNIFIIPLPPVLFCANRKPPEKSGGWRLATIIRNSGGIRYIPTPSNHLKVGANTQSIALRQRLIQGR
jgi:hypothetical protein